MHSKDQIQDRSTSPLDFSHPDVEFPVEQFKPHLCSVLSSGKTEEVIHATYLRME